MLGLILLLVLKVCSSNAVEATVGSNITLECTLAGSFTLWQKNMNGIWSSKLQDSSKYGNTNTASLTIFNIDVNDAGTYRCFAGSQQQQLDLIVTVPGTWTQWSQWTTCSKTCGVGESTRSRVCQGGSCSGNSFDSMNCTTTPCPVNGNWGGWGAWSTCSKTCDTGTVTRYRSCDNPAPVNGGSNCQGINYETTQCFRQTCPVNGNWGGWGAWGKCSTTCGTGTRTRYRSCNNPAPANGGSYCQGITNDTTQCFRQTCQVNGNWGGWGAWGTCSTTCGTGTRTRYRSCNNPAPVNGGSYCQGNDHDTTQCFRQTCQVNGNWGGWGAWGTCSTTCDSGTWTRNRSCNNPAPANSGSYCQGNDTEATPCSTTSCPVHGIWSAWEDWNSCSATCGSGSRSRYQECNNPEPAYGGSNCQGNAKEIESCSIKLCSVHGIWSAWEDWNSCSATCGSGSRSRYQECNNPEPANGGSDCQGNDTEIESCSIKLCPVASEKDNSSAAVGIGAGIGSTAVVIGLVILFFVILKRYRLGKPAESAIYTTAGDTESSNSDLHIYNGLQYNTESSTHRQKDGIYVNMVIWGNNTNE